MRGYKVIHCLMLVKSLRAKIWARVAGKMDVAIHFPHWNGGTVMGQSPLD